MTHSDLTQILDEIREMKQEHRKLSDSLVRVLELVRDSGDAVLINQVTELAESGLPADRYPQTRH